MFTTLSLLCHSQLIKILPLVLCFFTFSSCSSGSELINRIAIIPDQWEMMAVLTGRSEIREGMNLADRFNEGNREEVRGYLFSILQILDLKPERHRYSNKGENIYGTIPATITSSEYVVLGAHFDSVEESPGANDNASGTVLIFNAVRYIAELNIRTKHVIVVFFDEEERGLVGSRHFGEKLVEEGKTIHSVHTADQVGWDSDGDRGIELELPYDGIVDLYRDVARSEGLDIPIHITDTSSTDHSSFRSVGFNAVGITEEYVNDDTTPYYHEPSDVYGTIDFEYLEAVTLLFAKVIERIID